jgi:hypothetical protein
VPLWRPERRRPEGAGGADEVNMVVQEGSEVLAGFVGNGSPSA